MRSMGEGHPPVVAISRSCPVETLRKYNFTQSRREREGAKKMLAQPVIAQSYFGDDVPVTGIPGEFLLSPEFGIPVTVIIFGKP